MALLRSDAAAQAADERPPIASVGVLGWVRTKLFNSPLNAILSIGALALVGWLLPALLDWAFFSATWGTATPAECRAAGGACWAFINEKYRLILFGRYPYAEQWRPLLGMLVVIAAVGVSCNRDFWKPWLGGLWAIVVVILAILMWGGVLGLRYVENYLWGGLPLTLMLSVFGIVFSFPAAILLALGRRSHLPAIKALSVAYIELIRGVPLVALLFMASFMFPLFVPAGMNVDALLRAQVAIIMFTAAYLAEVIRGGLQAIPRGQIEAAGSLGLSYWQTMRKIVLPQALRMVIPPMVNTFIALFKDTSLVAIVGLTDLLLATRQAISDASWRAFFIEGYVFIALIYFCFCFFMSRYSQYLERRMGSGHGR